VRDGWRGALMDIPTAATYFPALSPRMAAAGITQSDLARALGHATPSTVNRWLQGATGARAESLAACEAAFQRLTENRGPRDPRPQRDRAS
jgi:hypothetical protein